VQSLLQRPKGMAWSAPLWIYGVLIALRVALAFSPGYIHPDEFFQGGQVSRSQLARACACKPCAYSDQSDPAYTLCPSSGGLRSPAAGPAGVLHPLGVPATARPALGRPTVRPSREPCASTAGMSEARHTRLLVVGLPFGLLRAFGAALAALGVVRGRRMYGRVSWIPFWYRSLD
jgi:hypothetical protein